MAMFVAGSVLVAGGIVAFGCNGVLYFSRLNVAKKIDVFDTKRYYNQGCTVFEWRDGELLYDYYGQYVERIVDNEHGVILIQNYYVVPIVPKNFNETTDEIPALYAIQSPLNRTDMKTIFGDFNKLGERSIPFEPIFQSE